MRCNSEGCQLYFDDQHAMRRKMVGLLYANGGFDYGGISYEIDTGEIYFSTEGAVRQA